MFLSINTLIFSDKVTALTFQMTKDVNMTVQFDNSCM